MVRTATTPIAPPGGASHLTAEGGVRQMKCYAVTEDELETLGLLQYSATACFSTASGLVGFAVSISQNMAFANGVAPNVQGFWGGLKIAAFVGAAIASIVGTVLVIRGRSKVSKIKRDTIHTRP